MMIIHFHYFFSFLGSAAATRFRLDGENGRVAVRHFTASARFTLSRPLVQERLGFSNLQVRCSLESIFFFFC